MTNPQITVLFIIGLMLTLTGALCKILNHEYASFFLIVGMTFNTVAAALLVLKFFNKNNTDSTK